MRRKEVYMPIKEETHKELFDFISEHRYELMIDFHDVVRLEEIVEGKDDLYYVYRKLNGGIYFMSCVGGPILLKGYISDDDYTRLESGFFVNCDTKCTNCETYMTWRQVYNLTYNIYEEK